MDEPRRPPGRPVDASLGHAILEAVLDVLAEVGYARLTTAAVARRAGVSTATLYRRWPSKRDLILAAAEQIAAAEPADADTGSIEGDLRELLATKRRVLSGKLGATLVALIGESAHDPELASVVRAGLLDPTRHYLAAILARAAARGEDATGTDPEAAARLVLGLVLADVTLGPHGTGEPRAAVSHGGPSEAESALLVRALTGPGPGTGPRHGGEHDA